MSRLSARDIATIAVFLLCGGVVVILALSGRTDWALATLGILASLIGIVARLQFAIRRASVRQQVEDSKASRRDSAQTLRATRKLAGEVADIRREFAADLSRTRTDVERGLADTADQVAGARTEVKSARAKLLQEVAAAREDVAGVRSAVSGVERMERRLEPDLVTDIQALMQLMSRYAPAVPDGRDRAAPSGPRGGVRKRHVDTVDGDGHAPQGVRQGDRVGAPREIRRQDAPKPGGAWTVGVGGGSPLQVGGGLHASR